MAVKARVTQDIQLTESLELLVRVDYYDDADPANSGVNATTPPAVVLSPWLTPMPLNATTAQLASAVDARGVLVRAAVAKLAAARAAVPAGTIRVVP